MVGEKCNYIDRSEKKMFNINLCTICSKFAPQNEHDFNSYVSEKIDWKILDTFRNSKKQNRQKDEMTSKASEGILMSRPPLGYDVKDGKLIPNIDASRVHSLFKTFLARKYSLNSVAKNFALSTNGLKKVLTNRTYLGEIKFDVKIFKSTHRPLISAEIFYAVQRKLREDYLKS